jgi:hypothetical protein
MFIIKTKKGAVISHHYCILTLIPENSSSVMAIWMILPPLALLYSEMHLEASSVV